MKLINEDSIYIPVYVQDTRKEYLVQPENGDHIYYNKNLSTNAQSTQNPGYKFCFQVSEPKQGGADGVWKETSREV